MKILIATSSVTRNGGISSYNRELSGLLGEDNELHLLVDEKLNSYVGYEKTFSTANMDIYDYHSITKLLKTLAEENYDVIINSNSHAMSLMSAYMNDSVRIITVSHSLGTMDCDNAVFNHKYVDCIIALSESCRDYISHRFRLKKEKISVVFNSVADNPNASSIRKTKIEAPVLKIVFAGGSAASKSPDIVIQVIKDLCKTSLPFKFYWLGITTPPLKKIQPFKDIRLLLPKDNRIIVTGLLPQQVAAELIASCNVFLAPSRREGFPMALLESMRVGCIPIVSDFKIANQEIIRDGVNGFLIPHKQIHSFSARIIDIISHHQKYRNIYELSYQTFVDKLSFPVWKSNIRPILYNTKISHKKRKRLSKFSFKLITLRFKFLSIYNLLENHIIEVAPCALKIYKSYKTK